jgi:hypothetical protein
MRFRIVVVVVVVVPRVSLKMLDTKSTQPRQRPLVVDTHPAPKAKQEHPE